MLYRYGYDKVEFEHKDMDKEVILVHPVVFWSVRVKPHPIRTRYGHHTGTALVGVSVVYSIYDTPKYARTYTNWCCIGYRQGHPLFAPIF